jgi:hypothetical protein
MNNTLQKRWLLDAALFAGFLLCFFLSLTGLQLHQILGMAATLVASYHLISHWNWVSSVSSRFFRKTSSQARFYLFIDTILAGGFLFILLTGLGMSTWLNLSLANYETWRVLHIGVSMTTLLALGVKIATHARWIVLVGKKLFGVPAASPTPVAVSGFSRRDFLKVIGTVGVASFIALQRAAVSLTPVASESRVTSDSASTAVTLPTPVEEVTSISGLASESVDPSGSDLVAVVDPTSTPVVETVAEVTAESNTTASTSSSATTSDTTCTVRCNQGCSFPGRCRRYTDSNANGRCDLGECVS